MLREITIGQYYPADSILHKLDPRVKFLGTIVFIVSLFLVKGAAGYALVTVCLAALIILSKVPFKFMVKGMKAIFFVLIITMLFNLFLTPGEIIGRWWIFKVTREGIVQAVRMGIRLTYLVIGSSLMTLTTTPNKLTDAMESLFSPLKVFHAPVHEIAMMMSIALRFIPILTEEADRIRKAQMARGADMESGGPIKRAKAMIPVFIPLLVSAFRRAFDLAMAMEARCYHGGKGRTKMKPLRYHWGDLFGYLYLACYMATIITLRIWQKI